MATESKIKAPWYAEGLRFECKPECGACCRNHGSYAYVYLNHDELLAISGFVELDVAKFKRRYTTLDEGLRVLRMDEPDCPFLDGARCSIYPVRPTQCRTFPFWEESLESPKAWRALTRFCPGIDEGPTHGLLTIKGHLVRRGDH